MKKLLVIFIVICVAAGACFLVASFFGIASFPVGYKNGHVIVYKQTCIDLSCFWSKQYYGKIDEATCIEIGGKPDYVTAAFMVERGYNGCSPD